MSSVGLDNDIDTIKEIIEVVFVLVDFLVMIKELFEQKIYFVEYGKNDVLFGKGFAVSEEGKKAIFKAKLLPSLVYKNLEINRDPQVLEQYYDSICQDMKEIGLKIIEREEFSQELINRCFKGKKMVFNEKSLMNQFAMFAEDVFLRYRGLKLGESMKIHFPVLNESNLESIDKTINAMKTNGSFKSGLQSIQSLMQGL